MPIYEIGGRENVNVAQLLLNISFAALAGALVSNLSRRAALWTVGGLAVAIAARFGLPAYHEQMRSGAEREEGVAYEAIRHGNFEQAKRHLLNAANYWRLKGWWEGARQEREHASDNAWIYKKFQEASVDAAMRNENRARELLRISSWNPRYPSDENVAEAKRLLLTAAEKWHIVGNTAEEQRVRAWEKNVKTEAEFLASLPDQPANQYISPDPNARLRDAESRQQWESEEARCREPFPYPPHKWTYVTQFGKTFAIIKFRERKEGDRKKELDGYAKAIGAKFYKQWSRVRQGGADWVDVFYK